MVINLVSLFVYIHQVFLYDLEINYVISHLFDYLADNDKTIGNNLYPVV